MSYKLLIPALEKKGWHCAHLRGISFYSSSFDVFRISKGGAVKEIVVVRAAENADLFYEQVFECTDIAKIDAST